MRTPPLTIDQLTAAKAAFEAGTSTAELARAYGVTRDSLCRQLKSVGWAPGRGAPGRSRGAWHPQAARQPPPPQPLTHLVALLIEDARRGLALAQIAARWHLPPKRVHQVLATAGTDPATSGSARQDVQRAELAHLEPHLAPLRIAGRTDQEQRTRRWTAPELEAIAVEIRAGRVARARRGFSGLYRPEASAERATRKAQSRWAHPCARNPAKAA